MNNFLYNTAFFLTIVGGLNWGFVGLFDLDLVAYLFGPLSILSRIVYVLVGLSAITLAIAPLYSHKEFAHQKNN